MALFCSRIQSRVTHCSDLLGLCGLLSVVGLFLEYFVTYIFLKIAKQLFCRMLVFINCSDTFLRLECDCAFLVVIPQKWWTSLCIMLMDSCCWCFFTILTLITWIRCYMLSSSAMMRLLFFFFLFLLISVLSEIFCDYANTLSLKKIAYLTFISEYMLFFSFIPFIFLSCNCSERNSYPLSPLLNKCLMYICMD